MNRFWILSLLFCVAITLTPSTAQTNTVEVLLCSGPHFAGNCVFRTGFEFECMRDLQFPPISAMPRTAPFLCTIFTSPNCDPTDGSFTHMGSHGLSPLSGLHRSIRCPIM